MTIFDVSFSSDAGALRCISCDATSHLHPTPDVMLSQQCPTHHKEWQYCVACAKVWCPGEAGRNSSHQGTIVTAATDAA